MAFLTWNNQRDTVDSLAEVNVIYRCPYLAANGYKMDIWDIIVASRDVTQWGFFKPEARLGRTVDNLMLGLSPGFTEHEEKPEVFFPELDVVFREDEDEDEDEEEGPAGSSSSSQGEKTPPSFG